MPDGKRDNRVDLDELMRGRKVLTADATLEDGEDIVLLAARAPYGKELWDLVGTYLNVVSAREGSCPCCGLDHGGEEAPPPAEGH